ncbi:histone-lysine N-methyltransferase ASHH2 [Macadamia integrifolia]|uniref:histone-lysine N-methyltransferase ASHH2 n=1 Tax=Macadamia integrifolia TaxID=60698 RepID=UPI001C4F47DE|nr:histone-lysine N-methyltransferase ASHH2 [Macadamia integrifolia]
MGSCEPSVLVEESLCGFPDGTVGELGITLGDMGGVTLESVDEFVDFQGCKDSVLDPDSSSGAACKLGNCIEDSIGRPVTEQFFCSEVACPLSNTNWDTTDPVDGCCDSSQNLRANLVGSSVGLGASISGRDDSFNRKQDTGGSVLERKPQDECGFPSSNTSGETKNPVDGCHASSKKIGANSVDFRLESPISGWDGSPYGQQDMGVLAHEQKLQDECELSGLCSTESDQYKRLCYSGTVGLYLERQGPCHEDEMGQLMVAEEMPLASVPLTFSQSKSSQCMELKVPGEADGLSAEAVTGLKEVKEEQCDVITRISVSLGTQVSLKEDNTCNLMEGPSDVACDRAVEEKIPQLSFQLCDVVDVGSGKSLAVPDLDEGCAPSCALICGRSVDSTVQMHNEDRDCAKPKNVSGPSVETVTDSQEVVEQNVLLGTLVNQSSQELRIEENICNLMQQSLNVASECSGEESTSLQSPLTLNVVANGSSKRSGEPDLQESNVLNGYLRCSSMVDAIDSAGNEGKANSKPHFVSESNCPDGVHVLPRRSTRVSKLNQMNETRNAGNQCNNKVNSSLPKRAIGISFKIARRKRSYSCKSARSSSWGVLGSIMQVFKQNEGILKQDSDLVQAQARGSRKTEGRKGSEKRKRIRASRDSRKSNGETNASIGSVRLKVKMGEKGGQNNLKDVLPQGDNPSANGETMINESLSELNCRTSIEIPCVGEMEHKLGEDLKLSNRSLEMPVTPLDVSVLDARLADKDLVSIVTQDISVGNSGDCHVSSQIGTESSGEVAEIKNSDPGTSPHSEVINVIQEVQVGAGMQVDLQDASFDLAQVVVPPEDVMGSNVLPMKAKKGKRNGKIKGSQNPVGGCCVLDEKMHGPNKFNKTRKLSKRRSRQKVVDGLNPGEAIISATSQNASSNNSSNEGFARDSFPSSELVELGLCHEALKIETSIEARELLSHDVGDIPPESGTSELSAAKTKAFEVSKTSKSSAGVNKSRSRVSDSVRGSRKNACAKEDMLKSKRKGKVKEEVISDLDIGLQENHTELGGSINVPLVKKDSETWGPDELSKFNLVSNETSSSLTRSNAGNNVPPANISSFNVVSNGFEEQSLPPRIAWVCCDDCLKWRCISAALADSIEETNCKWTCKDNADKAFSDCSIPQEKSNAEINKELDISDEEDAYDRRSNYKAFEGKQPTVPQQATWRLIKSNLFLHRSRKTQTIDEVMVCHCKPPPVGSLGCGDECLNRMLNIECVKGACPCGDLCSNQQFQKRNYAKFKQFRCGKKGYGLQLLENVSEGQFLIEYVGEVLDLHDYEARQREYASRGQKHFYFMTLNGSEVIDACAKGNLGRFINHSCEPNCRTEKWMVNGEICIGLFAIRDIKKGEEVTFDYNYVRVYGAAAKKCVCGSSVCRGYIGGDPLNAETIVRGDSDEEFPEPLMFDEDGCNEDNMDGIIPSTSSVIGAGAAARFTEIPLQGGDISSKSQPATVGSNILFEKEDTQRESVSFGEPSQSEFSLRMEDGLSKSVFSSPQVSVQNEGGMSKTSSSIQLVEVSLTKEETTDKYVCKVQTLESSSSTANSTKKCISSSVGSNKSRSDTVEDKPNISKSRPRVKASRSGSSKKGKCIVYPVITNKSQVMAKPRKQVDGAIRSRFEGVEEKLNELLDGDGGISKRKDASKGYLKLLVLTAASGDNGNGEAFQSARDLSIILDALMKTKSRTVLTDIINKNGLQMLHNILKQNRGDFKKIPILRKLLKVLEFLALKGILTLEHINGGPPHPGMESFKDSILTLTRHSDVQVHQIARTFRDRWIRRYSRRFNYFDRDDSKLEPQSGPNSNWFAPSYKRWQDPGVRPTEVINCASQATVVPIPVETSTQEGSSEPAVGSCPASGTRKRKRKSRWDQPAETKDDPSPRHIGEQKIEPNSGQKMDSSPQKLEISDPVLDQVIDVNREKKTCSGCVENLSQQNEVSARIDAVQHIEEDVPPGFASYLNGPASPSNVGTTITASLPTQIASPSNCGFEVITGLPQEKFLSHLPVSYGIPFPLVLQLGMLQPETIDCWSIAPGVPFHPFPPLPPFPREKSNPLPSPAAPDPVVMDGHVEAVQLPSHHVAAHNMDPSVPSTSGARPDAPVTRENNQDAVERGRGSSYGLGKRYRKWDDHATPRSPWRRNGWDNSRNGVRSVVVGNVANDGGGHCCSQDVNNEGKNARSCSYQHKPHQHHH